MEVDDMTFKASFKQMRSSTAIRDYAEEKSERLQKYFRGKISIVWNFRMERENRLAHCHLTGNSMDFFGEAETDDLRASIDLVFDKIERQLRKHKEIVKDHLHHSGHDRAPELTFENVESSSERSEDIDAA